MEFLRKLNGEILLNLSGVLVTALVGFLAIFTVSPGLPQTVVAVLATIQLLSFLAFLFTDKMSKKKALFWVEALVITLLYFHVSDNFITILSIVWVVQAVELYAPRQSVALLIGSMTMIAVAQFYHWNGVNLLGNLFGVLLYFLFQVFAFSTSQRAIRERELREETGVLNRELLATRELLAQTSAHSERVRIARDLHDILGHHMTALILNLEVAKHSAHETDPTKSQEKIEQSLSLAKLLLSDIRTAVSELRDGDAINLQHSIEKLLVNTPNLDVDLQLDSAPVIEDVKLAETLLRCVQEAITNVLRHSRATEVEVRVSKLEDYCVLTVSDNGGSSSPAEVGNGLKGMTERVHEQAGELSWQQDTEGFTLEAKLPLGRDQ